MDDQTKDITATDANQEGQDAGTAAKGRDKAPKANKPKRAARAAKKKVELELPGQDAEATKALAKQFFAGAGTANEPQKEEHQDNHPTPLKEGEAKEPTQGETEASPAPTEAETAAVMQCKKAIDAARGPATATTNITDDNDNDNGAAIRRGRKPRAERPTDETGITIRVSAKTLAAIDILARLDGTSVNTIVARLMETHAAANEEKIKAFMELQERFSRGN